VSEGDLGKMIFVDGERADFNGGVFAWLPLQACAGARRRILPPLQATIFEFGN
jgi:hypothetical protein